MDIKVDIDGKQINEMVVKAILDSTIGNEIKKAIDDGVKKFCNSWDSPIKKIVEKTINEEIYRVIQTEFKPLITKKVTEFLTDDIVSELSKKAWDKLVGRRR